jgi:magnesium and cobalt transporter
MAVDDAAALLDTAWDTDAATIGGLVTEHLGHLPAAGERVDIGAYTFTVERNDGRAIDTVIAERRPEPPAQDEARP